MHEHDSNDHLSYGSTTPSSLRTRRRKAPKRNNMFVASSSSASRYAGGITKPSSRRKGAAELLIDTSSNRWPTLISRFALSTLWFLTDILLNAMKLLKYPLTLLLAAYILSFLVSRVYLSLTTPLTSVLAGICRLPGSSLMGLEFCDKMSASQAKPRHVDYPKLMEIETQSFEKLLDNSISSTDLVFDLKKAEMATADLNTVLLASDLPIKDHLSTAIRAFVDDARGTGRALQRFDAKVEGAIDQ